MKLKNYVRLITVVGIAAVSGLFILKKPDGTPWLTFGDIVPITIDKNGIDIPGQTTVYRWKEGDSWSFANSPPDHIDETLVEIIHINPDTNLIQGLKPENEDPTSEIRLSGQLPGKLNNTGEDQDSDSLLGGIPLPLTIQPDQIKQLLEDAQNMQKVMDKRMQDVNSATGQ